ncbi:DUF4349 domain-containing protein [bacterium SCSIO 12741]|nr:DUF4349 domain-containing protein [bacterium SCSIO 12741]
MNRSKSYLTVFILSFILFVACAENPEHAMRAENTEEQNTPGVYAASEAMESEEASQTQEVSISDVVSSSTQPFVGADKKFIRKADLRFEVDDVYRSTAQIEQIAIRQGGFVTSGDLQSQVIRTETYPTDQESAIEVTEYETNCYVTLRVPAENLHQTLTQVAGEVKFLHKRTLEADDVTLKLVEQEMAQKRAQNGQKRLTGDRKRIKSKNLAELENLAYHRETDRDLAILRHFSLEDEVAYSTITIAMVQDHQITQKVVPNLNAIRENNAPGFGQRLGKNLAFGFELIQEIVLALMNVWPFLLVLSIVAGIVIRKTKAKK